jgi:hydrophobic/amphiphilic exporter-1 (mainly G- bacteria), HAE1 family
MKLTALTVRNGVTALMVFLIIIGFGLFSLARLRLDLYPDISFPTVMVLTTYTGASPEDVETLLTRPLESAVSGVKGVKEVRATAKQGSSLIETRFDWGQDMKQAETDVRRALDMVERLLPEDADKSMVFAFDPSMQPIIQFVLRGPYPLDELRRIAEREIEPRLVRLPGIAAVEIEGGLQREVRVELDPVKVAAFGLDVNQIVGAVYRENSQVPGGSVQQGSLEFTIHAAGKYRDVQEIGEVVIGAKVGHAGPVPLRLKEVARIDDTFTESQRILEAGGEPAVWVRVRKQSGANTVLASRAVMEALPGIKRAAAADIEFQRVFSQAEFINASLGNLSSTGMLGVGITFVVLLLFLRHVRSSLIVASSIPLSVVATFAVMDQAHMTLNILSMAGLALAVGMLVDNSIVVLENIFRLREEGLSPWAAAVQGASTVWIAVSGSTLTTIVVFVPVLFVPGIAGVLFRDMSITICFSLTVSLLVSLTFIPWLASRLLGARRGQQAIQRASSRGRFFVRLYAYYDRSLRWTLGHRWVVGVTMVGLVGVTAALATIMPTEFIAKNDQSFLFISAEAPVGSSLEEGHKAASAVAKVVEQVVQPHERELIAMDVGIAKGFVALFSKGVHAGTVMVRLTPPDKRKRTQAEIEDALRLAFKTLPGIKASVSMPFDVMGGQGDIEIQLLGHDLETSRQTGLELRDRLLAMPEMAEVTFSMDDQRPEVRVRFDRRKLGELGISSAAVGTALGAYFQGKLAGRYEEGGDEFDILVRYGKAHRLDIDEIRKMPISTPAGGVVLLGNVADVSLGLGAVDITRLDQGRVTRLFCFLREHYNDARGREVRKDLGTSIERVDKILQGHAWPKNFSYTIGGSAEDFLTSFRYLALALLVSVVLVYMVMASQFESLRQPFVIIFTVPLAGIGVMLTFLATRSNFDVAALIGVIMLVGIVVNNGIVMVDFADQLRRTGLDRTEAVVRAAQIRMRPVMMTSLTTILGMVPMALQIGEGSAGWAGLAKAVMGGLTFATLLTLFVVPTMYTIFASKTYEPPPHTDGTEAQRDGLHVSPASSGAT